MHLTDKAIRAARPGKELFDNSVPGFGLRVTPKGTRSWSLRYRFAGKQKRISLGTYPAYSLSEARTLARETRVKLEKGHGYIRSRRSEPRVNEALDLFIEKYAKPRNRTWRETASRFDQYVRPPLGGMHLSAIRQADVQSILDQIIDANKPIAANRLHANLRKFFRWCLSQQLTDFNPAENIAKPAKERSRDRVLNDAEIKKIWRACDTMGWPFGPLVQILLITGVRRNEARSMRWTQIDGSKWTVPAEITKSDRLHEVPLPRLGLYVLSNCREADDLVFSTTGVTPFSGFTKAKRRLDDMSGTSEWRLHDLRRTVASNMARLEVAPHVVERILNHSTGALGGVAG
ncbi:MAG: integrase family protein, partial [Alphaproteobacteria bacterium]